MNIDPRSDQPDGLVYRDSPSRLEIDNPPTVVKAPLSRVGYALLPQLPARWENVLLTVTSAADEVRTAAIVRGDADDPLDSHFRFFSDLEEPSLMLRRSMYEPDGRGAWYNAQIRVFRDGTIDAAYDFATPPFGCWGPREVALVIRDQELYPRDAERLPDWHPSR